MLAYWFPIIDSWGETLLISKVWIVKLKWLSRTQNCGYKVHFICIKSKYENWSLVLDRHKTTSGVFRVGFWGSIPPPLQLWDVFFFNFLVFFLNFWIRHWRRRHTLKYWSHSAQANSIFRTHLATSWLPFAQWWPLDHLVVYIPYVQTEYMLKFEYNIGFIGKWWPKLPSRTSFISEQQ